MKKRLAVLLLIVFAVTCCWGLAACNNDDVEKAIKLYKCDVEDTTVTKDFTLPQTIGTTKTNWSSDKPNVIKMEAVKDADWIARVTRPEARTEVTLTLKLGKATREIKVYVNPYDVYDFSDGYNFPYEKKSLQEDITDLETSYTINGKTATIKWEVNDDYSKPYIAIDSNGTTCKVTTPGDDDKIVKIDAVFTFNSVSVTKTYRMSVAKPFTHVEGLHKWYSNSGVSVDLEGWVVALADPYSANFGNVSFYMIDKDLGAGHYVYRAKADGTNGPEVKPGAYVKVQGSTNKYYSGLYETNGNGTVTVDKDKFDATKANTVYALDNDLFSATYSSVYQESRLVSLSNWTVDKKADNAPPAGNTATIFTLKKNDVKVDVIVSKYLKGAYDCKADDATWSALVGLYSSMNVGDVVSVTGILNRYLSGGTADTYNNNYQIMPLSAAAVTKGTADAEGTTYPGVTAKPVIDSIQSALKEKCGALITTATEVTLPTSNVDGVTVDYALIGTARNVKIESGKLVFTPQLAENVTLDTTVTAGAYTTHIYYTLKSRAITDAEIVSTVLDEVNFDINEIKLPEQHKLFAASTKFPDAKIEWSIKETVEGIVIEKGGYNDSETHLKVKKLPATATKITLVVTVSNGESSDKKEFTVNIAAAPADVLTLMTYDLGMIGENAKYPTEETSMPYGKKLQVASYGSGIQFKKVTGVLTLDDLGTKKIAKVVIHFNTTNQKVSAYGSDKDVRATIAFGKDGTFGETQNIEFVNNQSDYEFTPASADGECTQIKIANPSQKTLYIWSIVIYFAPAA